jgi:hypothetical protein
VVRSFTNCGEDNSFFAGKYEMDDEMMIVRRRIATTPSSRFK